MPNMKRDKGGLLEAVVSYWERGFAVIDWPQGVKGTTEKWADKTYDTGEKLRDAFGGEPKNVGIKLGDPSGGLVDVDLDCPEAAADAFLPRTGMVSGRPGNPRSHRWYLAPDAETEKWHAPKSDGEKGKVLLELRSTGQQTIVPPSVHPSGERLEWSSAVLEPAEVDAGDLREACRAVATVALIARCLPDEGRYDFAVPLAGFLLRPGRLDEGAALGIMEPAWDAASYPVGKDRAEAHRDLETSSGTRPRPWTPARRSAAGRRFRRSTRPACPAPSRRRGAGAGTPNGTTMRGTASPNPARPTSW